MNAIYRNVRLKNIPVKMFKGNQLVE